MRSLKWIRTSKKILQQVKSQVALRIGFESIDLADYSKNYEREFHTRWRDSSKSELIADVLSAQIVLGGDFHAFHQSQRVHLRILRELPTEREICLAVEFIESKDQDLLDQFMDGRLSEGEFLEAIDWDRRWGFPWSHYAPLLRLAREKGYSVVGLNKHYSQRSPDTLIKRDDHAAEIIATQYFAQPKTLIYVIFGDLHLAQTHLPASIKKIMGPEKVRIVSIFQNSERIYFQLARSERELFVNVVKLGTGKYCVLGAPPWVKWQSYLLFLEQTFDRELDEGEDGFDYTEHVHSLLSILSEELEVSLKLNDFSVYGPGSSRVWEPLARALSSHELAIAEKLVAGHRSFFVPDGGIFYLSRATINHAAGLAGHYLQARLSRRHEVLWNMPNDFLSQIWIEGIGFFCSKIVNHQRKSDSLEDIRARLDTAREHLRESLLLALDFSLNEVIWLSGAAPSARGYRPRRKLAYFEASRIVGSMLGERMYLAYRSGVVTKKTAVDWLQADVEDVNFKNQYRSWVRQIRPLPAILRKRNERL